MVVCIVFYLDNNKMLIVDTVLIPTEAACGALSPPYLPSNTLYLKMCLYNFFEMLQIYNFCLH